MIYGRGGHFNTEAALKAATQMQDWAKAGDFTDGYQGISGRRRGAALRGGAGGLPRLRHLVSSATCRRTPTSTSCHCPAPAGVKTPLSVGGVDLAWAITSNAKDKATQDLAAQYIDYMVSPEAAALWAEAGFFPSTELADPRS